MSHPSLGLPPTDKISTLPPAAARIAAARERLGARALEIALDRDPTLRVRHDEMATRRLLRDTLVLIDRVVAALAAGDSEDARAFAEAAAPMYRRRRVPMKDVIGLCEGVRAAIGATLARGDMGQVDASIDAMIDRFKWHGRIAGDHKRNRLLEALYKGA